MLTSRPMLNNLPLLLTKALLFCLFLVVGGGLLFFAAELLAHRSAPVVAFKAARHSAPAPHALHR